MSAAYAQVAKADEAEVQRILAALDLEGWAVLSGDIDDIIESIAKDGAYQALVQIGMDEKSMVSDAKTAAVDWANERVAELVGMRRLDDGSMVPNQNAKWQITDSTRDRLRSTVSEALDNGWSNQRLADAIEDSYAFSKERAMVIARTETALADMQGNVAAWEASGVVTGVEWVTAGDDLVSEECEMNGGEVVELGDAFPSGDTAPPLHPNCRCDLIPHVETTES